MYGASDHNNNNNNNSSSFQQNQDAQSSEQSRRNHSLPPRPPVSVDSYRPSYNGGGNGPNGRPMNNSSNNNSNQYYNSYGAQQGYSQGSYGQQQQQQRPPPQNPPYWDQQQQQQHGQYQQQYQQGYQQGYQQQQQPYQQQQQQSYGGRYQQAEYRKWWDQPTANYEPQGGGGGGRGNGYGPLEGGGVAVTRNDHHNQYDAHRSGGQTIPTGPRNDGFHSQNNHGYNNDNSGLQATIRKTERRKHKKERKRAERNPEQREQKQQQNIPQTSNAPGAIKSKGASVLPVPKPTEDYLALTESQLPEDFESRKLIILDLNDTLVNRGAPNMSGARAVRPRPFLTPFLDYIFKHFSVMVWSSARPQNVRNMVSCSFPKHHEKALVTIWSRENFGLKPEHYNAKIITYKNLEMVWDKIPHPQAEEGKTWDQTNTILVDDSVEKACAQPYNHLLIDVWDSPGKQKTDRTLLDVVGYLEKVVRGAGNVSQAMRESTYKPGTGKWEQFIPVEALEEKEMELNEEETVSKPIEEVMEVEKDNGAVETTVETAAVEDEDVGSEDDNVEGGIKLSQ